MSEDDTGQADRYLEPTGQFHPAQHTGIPVEVPGSYREATYGDVSKHGHPALVCPRPRYSSTLRGYYKCPACGEKMPLAGQVRATSETGERFAEAIAAGVVEAFWFTVDLARDIAWGVRWVLWWAGRKIAARKKTPETAPEMTKALLIMATVAARNTHPPTISEAKECDLCDL